MTEENQLDEADIVDRVERCLRELRMQISCIDGLTKESKRQTAMLAGIKNALKWVYHLPGHKDYENRCHCAKPVWFDLEGRGIVCEECLFPPVEGTRTPIKKEGV